MFIKLNFAVRYKRKLKYSKNNNIFDKIQQNQNKLKITYIRNMNLGIILYFISLINTLVILIYCTCTQNSKTHVNKHTGIGALYCFRSACTRVHPLSRELYSQSVCYTIEKASVLRRASIMSSISIFSHVFRKPSSSALSANRATLRLMVVCFFNDKKCLSLPSSKRFFDHFSILTLTKRIIFYWLGSIPAVSQFTTSNIKNRDYISFVIIFYKTAVPKTCVSRS